MAIAFMACYLVWVKTLVVQVALVGLLGAAGLFAACTLQLECKDCNVVLDAAFPKCVLFIEGGFKVCPEDAGGLGEAMSPNGTDSGPESSD